MVTLDYIRLIWEYNYWGHHKLWNSIMSISEADFKNPVPYSLGSVHEQIVHVVWAEGLWLARIHEQERIHWTKETHPTREAVRQQWDSVEADWRSYLASINEEELDRKFSVYSASRGKTYIHSIRDVLIHIVNHGTDHRSQILRLIHDYGGETFEQDMAFYFREKSEA